MQINTTHVPLASVSKDSASLVGNSVSPASTVSSFGLYNVRKLALVVAYYLISESVPVEGKITTKATVPIVGDNCFFNGTRNCSAKTTGPPEKNSASDGMPMGVTVVLCVLFIFLGVGFCTLITRCWNRLTRPIQNLTPSFDSAQEDVRQNSTNEPSSIASVLHMRNMSSLMSADDTAAAAEQQQKVDMENSFLMWPD